MILNYYKPKGISSFKAVSQVKKAVKSRKAGHAGTLDPLADGVLIVLTDKDTKKQQEFMNMAKEYRATVLFGVKSPSFDMETALEPVNTDIKSGELNKRLKLILPQFTGEIEQQVPAYSAVKVGGKRLYKLARKGEIEDMDIPVRKVTVHDIAVGEFAEETVKIDDREITLPTVELLITCSKGTYIRSLANDIGDKLGCGGVLFSLTRTGVGEFKLESSVKLEELNEGQT